MPEETPPGSVAACHEETPAITATTSADLPVEDNAAYVDSSPITPAAATADGPSVAMLEVKSDDGDKSVPEEEEVSREVSVSSGVEVGVEVAAVANEDELATAGEWYGRTR